MKIETGKYYRTRGGKKAFVACENPFHEGEFIGTIYDIGKMSWEQDGSELYQPKGYSNDLVEEWKEPQTFELIVKVYESNGEKYTYSCFTPHETGIPANAKLLSRKIITLTEGEIDAVKSKPPQTPTSEGGCYLNSAARSGNVSSEPHGGFNS